MERYFSAFNIFLFHEGRVAAGGWGVPFVWDGTPDGLPEGYRAALVASVEDHEAGLTPTALSFMAAAVARDYDRQGLATRVLQVLIERAEQAGIAHVVAPVGGSWSVRSSWGRRGLQAWAALSATAGRGLGRAGVGLGVVARGLMLGTSVPTRIAPAAKMAAATQNAVV